MGIRFDRDSRRATNGPVIFFSDPSSEIAFSEEIRGAINSGLSFYSYRHPGDMMISFGSSEGFVEGIGTSGFVIGMFKPGLPYITIPYKGAKRCGAEGMRYEIPISSTVFPDYKEEIDAIKKRLSEIGGGKVVAARVILVEEALDPGAVFFSLCKRFPRAYVFCFGTPATGCWIGASPELLLQAEKGRLKTMALAGTRKIGTSGEWDEKNIEEQDLVLKFISEVFEKNGLKVEKGETYSKPAGNIEHICTPVSSALPSGFNPEKLLEDLSPTPALCGYPREESLDLISRYEKFDRGCYGGFCGPYHSGDDFLFNVVLRCASVTERNYCIYSGGGITLKSRLEDEWDETALKAENFMESSEDLAP